MQALKEITNLSEEELKLNCPEDLKIWIEFIDKSSEKLKLENCKL